MGRQERLGSRKELMGGGLKRKRGQGEEDSRGERIIEDRRAGERRGEERERKRRLELVRKAPVFLTNI
jgi:hypothetical protein